MIGLLNAYLVDPDPLGYQAKYEPMLRQFLAEFLPGQTVKSYKVAQGELPHSLEECKSWIISGSPKGAYDPDPWIRNLGDFVQRAHQMQKKMIGVCFGHQLIAHFLGGRVEVSSRGWGVGVREFSITKQAPWMEPDLKKCSLIFSHQDQVVQLPPKANLLAKDPFCPYQMYTLDNHIFSLQGHPEFTPEFAKSRLDARREKIGEKTYEKAVQSLKQKTNRSEIGHWIRRFLEI